MADIHDLSIIFLSILLEAIPFILLGVFISAVIDEFVSPNFFSKIIPKNPILGSLVGVVMGFFVPACDCAVIPVSKRLIKKGVPINVAITFMLASPIINPVVILSTFYAFGSLIPKMLLLRTLFGIIIAIIIGFRLGRNKGQYEVLKEEKLENIIHDCDDDCHCHDEDDQYLLKGTKMRHRIINVFLRAKEEFWEICRFLIIGAFIASIMQVYIPRDIITRVGNNNILSIIVLMLFAYLLSLCSTSDSFVAKTFINQFSHSSVLAFLILGPMIDVKNTIVLTNDYRSGFILKLITNIFIFVFLSALLAGFIFKI